MSKPLISVIVPTKNSSQFLEACLRSIRNQTYKNIELIVSDNDSTDTTKGIAIKYADKVLNLGEEGDQRSAQRNFGVANANGEFVVIIDSDMELTPKVIEQCVDQIQKGFDAVVVHNTPDEMVGWIAKIRKFEVDMYKYDLTHSSARFVKREVYKAIGGFNERITAGEDYDFQNKLNRAGYKTGFINAEALHKGEPTSFWEHMMKCYKYGRDFVNYQKENRQESRRQLSFGRLIYFKNWRKFMDHPVMAISFLMYHFLKYGFGGVGYLLAARKKI